MADVVPLWSTAIGALLLAEAVGGNTVVGGLLIAAGILATRSRPAAPR